MGPAALQRGQGALASCSPWRLRANTQGLPLKGSTEGAPAPYAADPRNQLSAPPTWSEHSGHLLTTARRSQAPVPTPTSQARGGPQVCGRQVWESAGGGYPGVMVPWEDGPVCEQHRHRPQQCRPPPAGLVASAKSRSLSSLCLQRTSRAWLVGVEDFPGPPTGGMGQVLGLHSCEVSSTRRPPRGLGPGQVGKGAASTWPPAAPVLPPGVRAPARAGRGQEGPGRRPAWSLSDRSGPHESVSRFAQIPLSTSQTRQRGLGALHGAALPSRVLQAVGTGGTAWGPT